jgi:RNA-binding protein Musashi
VPAPKVEAEPAVAESAAAPVPVTTKTEDANDTSSWQAHAAGGDDAHMDHSGYNGGGDHSYDHAPMEEENYGSINVKEDG